MGWKEVQVQAGRIRNKPKGQTVIQRASVSEVAHETRRGACDGGEEEQTAV